MPSKDKHVNTAADIQAAADQAADLGYVGTRVDPTDDDAAYTVAGVAAGMPVPSAHDRAATSLRGVDQ